MLDEMMFSPLLDLVQELSENRASEVVWQTAAHVVFDEGFNDSLSERGIHHIKYFATSILVSFIQV